MLGYGSARIGVTSIAHLCHQDWAQSSNVTSVSGPPLWVCTPFPETLRGLTVRPGHRQRSAGDSGTAVTGADGCEEESLGAGRETGLGAGCGQLNPRSRVREGARALTPEVARVLAHVHAEVVLPLGDVAALGAHVVLAAGVGQHVLGQVAHVAASEVAQLTLVGLLTCGGGVSGERTQSDVDPLRDALMPSRSGS